MPQNLREALKIPVDLSKRIEKARQESADESMKSGDSFLFWFILMPLYWFIVWPLGTIYYIINPGGRRNNEARSALSKSSEIYKSIERTIQEKSYAEKEFKELFLTDGVKLNEEVWYKIEASLGLNNVSKDYKARFKYELSKTIFDSIKNSYSTIVFDIGSERSYIRGDIELRENGDVYIVNIERSDGRIGMPWRVLDADGENPNVVTGP